MLASKEEAEKVPVATSALYLACLNFECLVYLCSHVATSKMAEYVRAFWRFLDKNRNKRNRIFKNIEQLLIPTGFTGNSDYSALLRIRLL